MSLLSEFRPTRHRHAVLILILLGGLLLSLGGWNFARQAEEHRIEAEFQRRAAVFARLSLERLRLYREVAEQVGGFFAGSDSVSRSEFHRFTELILGRHSGIKALEWIPVVGRADRPGFEADLSRDYEGSLHIIERSPADRLVPAGDRPEYWPIRFVEPYAGNEATLGYDVSRVLTRPFIEAARAEREMRVSPQVRLLYTPQGERGPGVILIQPVFRQISDGQPAYIGFVQVVLKIADVLGAIRAEDNDPSFSYVFVDETAQMPQIRILQGGVGDKTLRAPDPVPPELAAAVAGEHPGALRRSLQFGRRDWLLAVQMNPAWARAQRTATPWLILGGELLITGLLGLFVHALLRRTVEIEEQVARRTGELAESRRQLASLLADMPGTAYRCLPEPPYKEIFISDGVLALTGHPAEAFLSGRLPWTDLVHPDDNPATLARIAEAVASHGAFELEYRLRHQDGTWRHVWERGHAVYHEDGTPLFLEGLMVDATALKRAEADKLDIERRLLEAQKLESLGVLAGGIAHDFNNILTIILGNATMARGQAEPASPVQSRLQQIEKASRRAADLCTQMLAYAGKSNLAPGRVDLAELVQDTAALLEISVPKGTRFHLNFAAGLPPVHADATQLRQIIMNLVLNAAESVTGRPGEITLSAWARDYTPEQLRGAVQSPDLPGGRYTALEVKDNGAGMEPETLARIFEPFFTTKFSGRGLGLSAVLGIVRSHRGALFAESQPGVGSTFRLLLPAVAETATADAATTARKPAPDSLHGTVLLVDDEQAVRQIGTMALEQLGLRVLEAANGEAALELFRNEQGAVDLVLLDLTMPGMGGEEALRRLRQLAPALKVIVMSGYSEGETMQRCASLGLTGFLAKPFELDALVAKVRPHLGG